MGVDTRIWLPNVSVENTGKAIGILAGLEPYWDGTADGSAKWIAVHGLKVGPTAIVGLAEIVLRAPEDKTLIGGDERVRAVCYHFEPSDRRNRRLLMPRSTPFWIAVGKRLVEFFGGEMDYQDCDEIDVDFARPSKSLKINDPQDGDEWDAFQRRLYNLKPLTVEEIKDADQYAAYKLDGTR